MKCVSSFGDALTTPRCVSPRLGPAPRAGGQRDEELESCHPAQGLNSLNLQQARWHVQKNLAKEGN